MTRPLGLCLENLQRLTLIMSRRAGIHHWKNKPLHLKVAITQHPLFIACKKSPLSVGIIIILLVFCSAKVFAQPEPLREVGIERQEYAQIKPLKAPKKQEVQLATVQVETPQTAPVQPTGECTGNKYADYIYLKESGCDPAAVNPSGCRGLGQACPGDKLPCTANFACQHSWFSNYAMERYGSWEAAYNFWVANSWW